MPLLRTWSPYDALLGHVAPLALASAAPGSSLVVDLDPSGSAYFGGASLAGLVADGPHRTDLSPSRRGVAVLRNGGIAESDAADVLAALVAGWPHVVLRMPPLPRPEMPGVVRVVPLGPGFDGRGASQAVYQRGPWPFDRSLPGVVLPRPRASTIRSLLEGRRPPTCRWLRAWRAVWGLPWP